MRKRIAIGVVVALFGGAIAAEAQPTSADLAHAHFVLERTLLTTDIYSDPRVQRSVSTSGTSLASCMTTGAAKTAADASESWTAAYEYAACIDTHTDDDTSNFTSIAGQIFSQELYQAVAVEDSIAVLVANIRLLRNVTFILSKDVD